MADNLQSKRPMRAWMLAMFLALACCGTVSGNPDTLILALNRASTLSERAEALNDLSHFQIKYNFRKSVEFGLEALRVSREAMYLRGEGLASLNLGWTYWQNSFYRESLQYLTRARHIFTSIGDKKNLSKASRITGLLYYYIAKSDSAIKYLETARDLFQLNRDSASLSLVFAELSFVYNISGDRDAANEAAVQSLHSRLDGESIRAQFHTWSSSGFGGQAYQNEHIVNAMIPKSQALLEARKEAGDAYGLALASSEIGNFFQIVGNFDSALHYHRQSLAIYESLGENQRKGFEWMDIGECHLATGALEQSQQAFSNSFQLLSEERNHPGMSTTLDYMGKIAQQQRRYNDALGFHEKALILSDTLGHVMDVIRFNRRLSDTYRGMRDFNKAIEAARKSYDLSVETGAPDHIMWGAEKLFMAYKASGNFREAFDFLSIYNELAIQREKNLLSRENQRFQSLFELNQKVQMIEQLNQENSAKQARIDLQRFYLVSAVSGIAVILLFAIILGDRVKKIRKLNHRVSSQNTSLQAMNRDKEVLLKEVHHRVKNNLQMISSLMGMQKRRITDERTRLVFSYTQSRLKSIGLVHEHLYKKDTLSTIHLKPYVEDLVEAILESFQSGPQSIVALDISEAEVGLDTAIPVGLILNELITNAVQLPSR